MASVRVKLVVLNWIYPWLGIFMLFLALQQTPPMNIVYFWGDMYFLFPGFLIKFYLFVLALTSFGAALGRMALRTNRSDMTRIFAAYVFVCLVLQVVVEGYLYAGRPDQATIVETIKQELAIFDTISKDLQECIQEIQQDARCCGISSWSDFNKAPSGIPDSCCGRYSPSTGSMVGHCTVSKLEETPGCKDVYYQMMKTPVGLLVLKTVSCGIQLLLSIFAFIHSKQLLRQNGENIPIVS